MVRIHLLPLLVLGAWSALPSLQAQSLSGGRTSTAGGGSPLFGGSSRPAFSQGPQIVGGPPGPSVGRTPPRNFNAMPLPLQPPESAEARGRSTSATPLELFPRNNDKTPDKWMTGPSTGIDLDQARDLLVSRNLDLNARYSDISQADADVLTASLRSNPIAYSDANGVPYGNFRRAAGPLQYDVNFVYPIDVSHKRQTRTRSAVAARMVVEAGYRDAVRLTIDSLYTAFVDALAMQIVIDSKSPAAAHNVWQEVDIDEPQSSLEQAERSLALLLNVPISYIHDRKLFGRLQFTPEEESRLFQSEHFVSFALANRPDLQAQRLAVSFAESNINAVLAGRFDDLLLLVQPYTFHDGRQGTGINNSLTWTVGMTVPLPLFNRQQGNILKARQAAQQARTRLESLEKTVASEVEAAVLEHTTSHEALARTWADFQKFKAPSNLVGTSASDYLWPKVDLIPWEDIANLRGPLRNRIVVGPDNRGVLHVRFFDIAGGITDKGDTRPRRNATRPFSRLREVYDLVRASDSLPPGDEKKLTDEDRSLQLSDIISRAISIIGTPEQKLNDMLRRKLTDNDNRITDLLDDQISDKLKTYWETLIRHRKSMLKLNTVTAVCLAPQ